MSIASLKRSFPDVGATRPNGAGRDTKRYTTPCQNPSIVEIGDTLARQRRGFSIRWRARVYGEYLRILAYSARGGIARPRS